MNCKNLPSRERVALSSATEVDFKTKPVTLKLKDQNDNPVAGDSAGHTFNVELATPVEPVKPVEPTNPGEDDNTGGETGNEGNAGNKDAPQETVDNGTDAVLPIPVGDVVVYTSPPTTLENSGSNASTVGTLAHTGSTALYAGLAGTMLLVGGFVLLVTSRRKS